TREMGILRRHDTRERLTDSIAEDVDRTTVQPSNPTLSVDDVSRDRRSLKRVCDIDVGIAVRHGFSNCLPGDWQGLISRRRVPADFDPRPRVVSSRAGDEGSPPDSESSMRWDRAA